MQEYNQSHRVNEHLHMGAKKSIDDFDFIPETMPLRVQKTSNVGYGSSCPNAAASRTNLVQIRSPTSCYSETAPSTRSQVVWKGWGKKAFQSSLRQLRTLETCHHNDRLNFFERKESLNDNGMNVKNSDQRYRENEMNPFGFLASIARFFGVKKYVVRSSN